MPVPSPGGRHIRFYGNGSCARRGWAGPATSLPRSRWADPMLTLDLHPIFRSDSDIDRAVRGILFEAVRTKAPLIEIIPGKGSGQLKRRVLALLGQKHLRKLYTRIETDATNAGRIYVHVR